MSQFSDRRGGRHRRRGWCGYYAYFDGGNDYAGASRVTAIIEGYGTCTVGTRGFRAEKARLLAFVHENSKRTHPEWYDQLADWLSTTDSGAILGAGAGAVGIVGTIASIALNVDVSAWFAPLILLAATLIAAAVVIVRADFHAISRRHPSVSDVSRCADKSPPSTWELVRRNYPNVPVYSSTREALKAHPLTPPPDPTPATCVDFWTRSAS